MAIVYRRISTTEAEEWFPQLVDLYAVVYAEPPYEEGLEQIASFREGLPDEAARAGFALIVAEDKGTLVGAAYGWTMPVGRWWSRADSEPPSGIRSPEKFAVLELIVHPQQRRHGVGGTLLRMLLTGRSEQWATLASDPRSDARRIYHRLGWAQVGQSVLPWGQPMDLLVLPLHGDSPAPV